ncbi:F-box/kelch-repeat protein [Raphanus sativus]|nr:F-box/kelch-repeat protein [Raphanus sativus]
MSENMEQFLELSVSSPLIPGLPDDVTVNIVARVPRSQYPTLSLVSKSFRELIASPKLYKERSFLGFKEHRVYAALQHPDRARGQFSFYILHRKLNCSNRLVPVKSIRLMFSLGGSYVPVGSEVYVFDDIGALSIDCTSHTVQRIPHMPQEVLRKVANVVDGKIYVIGESLFHEVKEGELWKGWKNSVSVFDIETQLWEPILVMEKMIFGPWSDSVVMDGKIYMRDCMNGISFVYEPEERICELMDEVMDSKAWEGSCVVDDVLYYYDWSVKVLRAYDPKLSCWTVVNGLEEFLPVETARSWGSKTVNYGDKKLALFFPGDHDGKEVIFCAEIALERRQGGEIWGKVESCDVVIEDVMFRSLKWVSVTV